MIIANPIYDSVFKYLMDDKRVAKVILSAITGFDIEDVQLKATEVATALDTPIGRSLTVYRVDFAAHVRTGEGRRLVLIEIQKAKLPTDIMRFRRYLGVQYSSLENSRKVSDAATGRQRNVADPIFTIYLLGHRLEHTEAPVVRVSRTCFDVATGETLVKPEEFIESLTHDSVVIQIPLLRDHRRNRLEQLLSIFDQGLAVEGDPHGLKIDEKALPKEYGFILRKLLDAYSEDDLRQKMVVEDEILSELEEWERTVAVQTERAEAAEQRAEEERRQKEVLQAKLEAGVKALMAAGMSEADARKLLGG